MSAKPLQTLQASLESMLTRQRLNNFGKARGDEVKGISPKMWEERDTALKANFGKFTDATPTSSRI
jgi:hypothetical protein